MDVTLGDKIKINGEEVPEYLLIALYENLKIKFSNESALSDEKISSLVKSSHLIK